MVSERKERILRIIVEEYVSNGVPVGSGTIARSGLGVSPATVRNEMYELEEQGYLTQPHTSAGRIPSDKGYRHYVEALMSAIQLSSAQQRLICHQFHQVEREAEEWTRLAAAILSRMLNVVAIVTVPKPSESRLQHLELVSLQELLVLLVLVLREAKIKHQILAIEEAVTEEALAASARRLNIAYAGLAPSQFPVRGMGLTPFEEQVTRATTQIMQSENEEEYEEPHIDGLRHILGQPEFASNKRLAAIVELLEQRNLVKSLLPQVLTGEGLRVVIGGENRQEAMHDFSVVVTRYGIPGEVGGAIGVVGPTRMQYGRAIPAVSFLSEVMSDLVNEVYG
jgi:heat-inducible transcriptional repressor